MSIKNIPPGDHLVVHPGEILKEEYMEPRGITVTELAKGLGMNRSNISNVVNGHTGISVELALKLSQAFGISAEFWLNLQRNYDLRLAKKKMKNIKVRNFTAIPKVA